jgi:PAS domain S-box-containing protein
VPTGLQADGGMNRDVANVFESRACLDSFTEGLIVHDLEGRIIDANSAATTLLGVTRYQLLARTPFDPRWNAVKEDGSDFPGDEHPAMVVLRTRRPCIDVITGVDVPVAPRRWIKISAHPIVVDERLEGVSSIFADVTAAKALQNTLRETDDLLRIVAQNAADVVVLASKDAVAEWISESVTELLGWTPEELVGRRIDTYIHPDDLGEVVNFRADSPKSLTAAFFVRLCQKDGDYRWIAISSRRFTDHITHASRIVSSWRDAQDLVATRQQLEGSEARFRFLAENASDIVVETDANFNATWTSPSVSDLLGWRPEAILERSLAEFIMPDDLPAVRYERASVEAGIKSNNIKIRCLTESGSYRWMVGRAR